MSEQNVTKYDSSADDLDYSIATILISTPGITDSDLASRVGLTRQTANRRRNSDQVKGIVAEQCSLSTESLKKTITKAIKTLESCLESPDERIRLAAALPLIRLVQGEFRESVRTKGPFEIF